jgi:cell division protein FtsX
MIRSPLQPLRHRPAETAAIIALLAIACALPASLLMASTMTQHGLKRWLHAYEPVITLKHDVAPAQIAQLEADLRAVPYVASITSRSPKDALAIASQRLGPEQTQALGLVPDIFPHSIVIHPEPPVHGHLSLVAHLSSFEAHPAVEDLDLPSPSALQALSTTHNLILLTLLLLTTLLATSTALLAAFLKRLEDDQHQELAILELFGAPRRALTRPSTWRALVLGASSGLLATCALLAAQVTLAAAALNIFAIPSAGALTWWIVPLPIPTCILIARASAALAAQRTRRHDPSSPPNTKNLLLYGQRP